MKRVRIGLGILLSSVAVFIFSLPLHAQGIEQCRDIDDPKARLECFDSLVASPGSEQEDTPAVSTERSEEIGEVEALLEEARVLLSQGKKEAAAAKLREANAQRSHLKLRSVVPSTDNAPAFLLWVRDAEFETLFSKLRAFSEGGDSEAAALVVLGMEDYGKIPEERKTSVYCMLGKAFLNSPASELYDGQEPCVLGPRLAKILFDEDEGKATSSELEIVSVDSRSVESNDSWSKWAWLLTVRNSGTNAVKFSATIQWLDSSGFVLEDDTEYNLTISAGETETFSDYDLLDPSTSSQVSKVKARLKVR